MKCILLLVLVASTFGKTKRPAKLPCMTTCAEWLKCVGNTCVPNTRVLFLGNSLSKRFDSTLMFGNLARAAGKPTQTRLVWGGAASLQSHSQSPWAIDSIYAKNWTAVFFQDQSSFLSEPIERAQRTTWPYARQLFDIVKLIPQRRVILFDTWAYLYGNVLIPNDSFQAMQSRLTTGIRALQTYLGDAEVCGVGPAFGRYAPLSDLFDRDGKHPSKRGAYLAALCYYACVFRESSDKMTWRPKGISAAAATPLRAAAAGCEEP